MLSNCDDDKYILLMYSMAHVIDIEILEQIVSISIMVFGSLHEERKCKFGY
jgi:hypothetical protein